MVVFCPFRSGQVTSMSHRVHHGWGRLPSSSIITVYQTRRCKKRTHIDFRIATRPRHPSTGQFLGVLQLVNPYYKCVSLRWGPWSPYAISIPMPSCAAYVGVLTDTPTLAPPFTPNTVLSLPVSPGKIIPRPSSDVHMPPPTGCPLPDTNSRPF